jgi:hypothetical protein
MEARSQGRRGRRLHAGVGAPPPELEVAAHPNGIGNSSGHVGHNFCEHVMGPGVDGFVKDLVGKPRTLDDGRPGGFYIPRFRNLKDKQKDFVRGYGFEGSAGHRHVPRRLARARLRRRLQEVGPRVRRGDHRHGRLRRGALRATRTRSASTPRSRTSGASPSLRFDFKFGENEKKMAADMANTAKEIFEEAGIEVVDHDRHILTEGWSIHELGTARMGNDPKTSVLTQHQQSHDVKNLFVVDGSSHVSASCQNPTWTIMALAWRSCDYLADELRKGNL